MQNHIAVAVDLSPSLIDAQRQEAYDFQKWNHVTASDAVCITLGRKHFQESTKQWKNHVTEYIC